MSDISNFNGYCVFLISHGAILWNVPQYCLSRDVSMSKAREKMRKDYIYTETQRLGRATCCDDFMDFYLF